MRDGHETLPLWLGPRNSTAIISRHPTADAAWEESERLGEQPLHSFEITDAMGDAVQRQGMSPFERRRRQPGTAAAQPHASRHEPTVPGRCAAGSASKVSR
jgi:hypothetical protein